MNHEENKVLLAKWLPILLYIHIASLILTVLGWLPLIEGIQSIPHQVLMGVELFCLWRMKPVHHRFGKAAMFGLVTLLVSLVRGENTLMMVLVLASSVCSIVGSYNKYIAFSELADPVDPDLGKKWKNLFYWEVFSGLILGTVASLIVTVLALANPGSGTETSIVITWASNGVALLLQLLNLRYLKQTIGLIQTA